MMLRRDELEIVKAFRGELVCTNPEIHGLGCAKATILIVDVSEAPEG